MRRRRSFATPFVITAACYRSPSTPANPPPPDEKLTAAEHLVPIDPVLRAPPHDPPDEQPSNPPPTMTDGALVVQPYSGSPCYLVYEREMRGRTSRTVFDEGAVPCPPGGPNVKLPAKTEVTIGRERYRLELESLQCRREILGNPPSWRRSECPPSLLPELVGLTPDEHCVYRGVTVKAPSCQPARSDGMAVNARIIAANVVADGVVVVLAAGTDKGIAPGMIARLRGVGTAKITDCNARTCRATFKATLDQIHASPASVTFE